jgi:hypothetical protein
VCPVPDMSKARLRLSLWSPHRPRQPPSISLDRWRRRRPAPTCRAGYCGERPPVAIDELIRVVNEAQERDGEDERRFDFPARGDRPLSYQRRRPEREGVDGPSGSPIGNERCLVQTASPSSSLTSRSRGHGQRRAALNKAASLRRYRLAARLRPRALSAECVLSTGQQVRRKGVRQASRLPRGF